MNMNDNNTIIIYTIIYNNMKTIIIYTIIYNTILLCGMHYLGRSVLEYASSHGWRLGKQRCERNV